jgi:hypothetical protein
MRLFDQPRKQAGAPRITQRPVCSPRVAAAVVESVPIENA